MSVEVRRIVALVTLVVAVVIAVGFGVASSYGLALRLQQVASGKTHRPLLTGERCESCHDSVHRPPLTGACENCHVTSTWESVSYRHARPYLNSKAHRSAPCNSCHPQGRPVRNVSCGTCHKTYAHKVNEQCKLCHVTQQWKSSHSLPRTHPKLVGDHAKATCPDCHTLHTVKKTWSCGDCHTKKHDPINTIKGHEGRCTICHNVEKGKDNLNKVAARAKLCGDCHGVRHKGFPKCQTCHTENTFKKARYDHEKGWPLRGAHTHVACTKCHPKQQWATSKGTSCSACHRPGHSGLSSSCLKCHTQDAFKPSTFRHSSVYALSGAHARIACTKCHPNRRWASNRGSACSNCHGVKHGGLKACSECHTTNSFKPATFSHAKIWRLTGAHKKIECSQCHPGNRWAKSKGTTCVACHGKEHGGETACSRCHTTSAWRPTKDIQHTSDYPLIGQHRYVECVGCHANLIFKGTPRACYDCHADLSHGMRKCEDCHTPVSWSIITYSGGH